MSQGEVAASAAPNVSSQIVVPPTNEPKPVEYVIVSVDVETTGSTPGQADMISLGAATLHLNDGPKYERRETFYRTIVPVYGRFDPDTMEFWNKWPERWRDTQEYQQPANQVMQEFADWVNNLGSKPIFMAWPVHFDFKWVDHYFSVHGIKNPFGYKCLDQISYIAGLLKKPEIVIGSRSSGTLKDVPELWEGKNEFPHHALTDAIAQLEGFQATLRGEK